MVGLDYGINTRVGGFVIIALQTWPLIACNCPYLLAFPVASNPPAQHGLSTDLAWVVLPQNVYFAEHSNLAANFCSWVFCISSSALWNFSTSQNCVEYGLTICVCKEHFLWRNF